jgi:hypothetical protein
MTLLLSEKLGLHVGDAVGAPRDPGTEALRADLRQRAFESRGREGAA